MGVLFCTMLPAVSRFAVGFETSRGRGTDMQQMISEIIKEKRFVDSIIYHTVMY